MLIRFQLDHAQEETTGNVNIEDSLCLFAVEPLFEGWYCRRLNDKDMRVYDVVDGRIPAPPWVVHDIFCLSFKITDGEGFLPIRSYELIARQHF